MIIKLKFNIDEYSKEEFSEKVRDIPYMDTFIYGQKSRLSNFEPLDNKYYVLTDTDGEPLEVIPQYTVDGQRIETDDLDNYEWSNTQNGWVYRRRGYYVASEKDFFSLDYLKDPKNGFILFLLFCLVFLTSDVHSPKFAFPEFELISSIFILHMGLRYAMQQDDRIRLN